MANLKQELDNYLSRGEKQQLKISMPVTFSKPDVGKWFSTSPPVEESNSNGWFSETQKDCCPSMSRTQRIMCFCFCIAMGMLCFILAGFYAPLLLIKARKFALLYTLGSLFTICSFSFLWGPMNHLRHLFSTERLPFTSIYFGTLFATLYFALSIQSTLLTVVCAIGQVIALMWFLVSYIPGGQTGLKFFTKLCSSAVSSKVSKTLPV